MTGKDRVQVQKSSFRSRGWLVAAAMMAIAAPGMAPGIAHAQMSDSYNFLKAVRDGDGAKVMEFLNKPGSTIVNTRDSGTGDTALILATNRRDAGWLSFLLGKGANPNLANSSGMTPLMAAAQLRFIEGGKLLIEAGAQVDKTDRSGVTALIRAVQLRDLPFIRMLVAQGANPDKRDLTGMSARDYAEQDPRGPAMLEGFKNAKPTPPSKPAPTGPVAGPVF